MRGEGDRHKGLEIGRAAEKLDPDLHRKPREKLCGGTSQNHKKTRWNRIWVQEKNSRQNICIVNQLHHACVGTEDLTRGSLVSRSRAD